MSPAWPLLLALGSVAPGGDAGLLLEGATVYVAAEAAPQSASILIRDGKIAFVGEARQARAMARDARVVDLTGRFVFAGWSDAHGHLYGLGEAIETADLRGAASASVAARRMAEKAALLPSAVWAEGRGWDQNLWPGQSFPDANELDGVLPERPALARRVDGHALWVNSAALRVAGVTASTPDPEGGRILRRPDGSPSGVLIDNAKTLVEAFRPAPSTSDRERRLLAAARACARAGLTAVQDGSAYGPESIEVLERLAARGELPIRVYATISAEPAAAGEASPGDTAPRLPRLGKIREGKGSDFLTVRAMKAYADGALGSRGAALLADYSDEPGWRGLLVTPAEWLDALAIDARSNGWQLWIHAIGDRGNRIALDAFRKAARAVPKSPPGGGRPRIEHAQVVALSDLARFGAEGVIASIQPTHATSDMPWAERRVGPERIRGAYAWRSLKTAGARLAGGSDFPVESENPLLGFYAAVTRKDRSGRPPGGWRPQEKLTRSEALALFTSDAAYAAFEEERRGRVAVGYEADLTVLARDPMTVAESDIPAIVAPLVIVGGRVFSGEDPAR
jgi:predicted amidohydrolase YtcJ